MDVDTLMWYGYLSFFSIYTAHITTTHNNVMDNHTLKNLFNDEVLEELFPAERTNDFFEALFGDAGEGAFDIKLRYYGYDNSTNTLQLNLDLHERPGCCLVCSLTYGLPEVFSRHPIINVKGIVSGVEEKLDGMATCSDWKLGSTIQQESSRHTIPLTISLNAA